MEAKRLVPIDEYCSMQSIETSFIFSLQKSGLIEITTIKDQQYLDPEQLYHIERFIVLHYELDINLEGIETIDHLLKRIEIMNNEITKLKNNLRSFEIKSQDEQLLIY